MRTIDEHRTRLVETEVSVRTYAEDLDLDICLIQNFIEFLDIGFYIADTLGNVGVGLIDIDMVEKIAVHEVAVALVVCRFKTYILIQIYSMDLREIQAFLLATTGKFLIHADRAGTCSQSQCALRLLTDDLLHDVCSLLGAILIVLCDNDFHKCTSLYDMILSAYFLLITILP